MRFLNSLVPSLQRPSPDVRKAHSDKEDNRIYFSLSDPASGNGLAEAGRTCQGSPLSLR
jgi:hypothetical protein